MRSLWKQIKNFFINHFETIWFLFGDDTFESWDEFKKRDGMK